MVPEFLVASSPCGVREHSGDLGKDHTWKIIVASAWHAETLF